MDDKNRWTWNPTQTPSISNAQAQKVLSTNFYRRGLIIGNPTAVTCFIGNDENVTATNGFISTSSLDPLIITYDDFGGAVCREWWAMASAINSRLAILECVAPNQLGA